MSAAFHSRRIVQKPVSAHLESLPLRWRAAAYFRLHPSIMWHWWRDGRAARWPRAGTGGCAREAGASGSATERPATQGQARRSRSTRSLYPRLTMNRRRHEGQRSPAPRSLGRRPAGEPRRAGAPVGRQKAGAGPVTRGLAKANGRRMRGNACLCVWSRNSSAGEVQITLEWPNKADLSLCGRSSATRTRTLRTIGGAEVC